MKNAVFAWTTIRFKYGVYCRVVISFTIRVFQDGWLRIRRARYVGFIYVRFTEKNGYRTHYISSWHNYHRDTPSHLYSIAHYNAYCEERANLYDRHTMVLRNNVVKITGWYWCAGFPAQNCVEGDRDVRNTHSTARIRFSRQSLGANKNVSVDYHLRGASYRRSFFIMKIRARH